VSNPNFNSLLYLSFLFYSCSSSACCNNPLQIRGGLRGTHDRKEALEGDQELYQLLLISKRPLLAMRPANSGGEGERFPCPSRFKSAGAGEYTEGAVVGAEAEERRA
jgi:hypothetical protein